MRFSQPVVVSCSSAGFIHKKRGGGGGEDPNYRAVPCGSRSILSFKRERLLLLLVEGDDIIRTWRAGISSPP